jgi:hypothetical protein
MSTGHAKNIGRLALYKRVSLDKLDKTMNGFFSAS